MKQAQSFNIQTLCQFGRWYTFNDPPATRPCLDSVVRAFFIFLDFPQLSTCQNFNLTDFISSRDYEKIHKIKWNLSLSVYADLWKTGLFERMSLQTDEDEHSIEMHLPYTAKAMER